MPKPQKSARIIVLVITTVALVVGGASTSRARARLSALAERVAAMALTDTNKFGNTLKHTPQPTTAAITVADLKTRLYIYSDDSMMGRQYGTIGNMKATNYIEGQVRAMGLLPMGENGTFFQKLPMVIRKYTSSSTLSANGTPLRFNADFVPVPGQRAPKPIGKAQVIYGGVAGDAANEISPEQAVGKFVILAAAPGGTGGGARGGGGGGGGRGGGRGGGAGGGAAARFPGAVAVATVDLDALTLASRALINNPSATAAGGGGRGGRGGGAAAAATPPQVIAIGNGRIGVIQSGVLERGKLPTGMTAEQAQRAADSIAVIAPITAAAEADSLATANRELNAACGVAAGGGGGGGRGGAAGGGRGGGRGAGPAPLNPATQTALAGAKTIQDSLRIALAADQAAAAGGAGGRGGRGGGGGRGGAGGATTPILTTELEKVGAPTHADTAKAVTAALDSLAAVRAAAAATTAPTVANIRLTKDAAAKLMGKPIDGLALGTVGGTVTGTLNFVEVDGGDYARNVIAMAPGSDPKLRGEYIIISGHNDHNGIRGPAFDHDSAKAYKDALYALQLAKAPGTLCPPASVAAASIHINVDSLHKLRPARMDSIQNGADDDGSGSVAVLEIAEYVSHMAVKPKRSILFIWHTGEEAGELGSAYYSLHPTVPLDSIVTNINIDMIARGRAEDVPGGGPRYVGVVGSGFLSKDLANAVTTVNKQEKTPLDLDYRYDHAIAWAGYNSIYTRSDHYNYAKKCIPIVFFFTGLHMDYHQNTDEAQYVDYPHYALITNYIKDLLLNVSNADQRPALDTPCTRQ